MDEVEKLKAALEFAVVTMSHAMELGYVGEGSTRGMFEDAIAKAEALGVVHPADKE